MFYLIKLSGGCDSAVGGVYNQETGYGGVSWWCCSDGEGWIAHGNELLVQRWMLP